MTEPVDPTTPYTVTLQAQQWNGVIGALVKAPYEVAAPLIQAITQQLQAAQAPQTNGTGQSVAPPSPPLNGTGLPAAA